MGFRPTRWPPCLSLCRFPPEALRLSLHPRCPSSSYRQVQLHRWPAPCPACRLLQCW
uniref:Macaca fascicularis brain cDNA clone: QflA-18904, similar to human KIAA0863 protein (KIAA0863), mRNA, RefSeq: XM_377498.1 n=1 Tax=Macaca fascicularis TaxID=9541 RepID=I7G5X6_MACFA|nr:unnamed protein product [Macaca fascicularis]